MPLTLDRWNDFWDGRRARMAAWIVLAALLASSAAYTLWRVARGSSEFSSFYQISRVIVLEGRDVHDVFRHKRAYPPFFAFAFFPFSWPPMMMAGATLCWAFNAAAMLLCPYLCVKALWPPGRRPRFGVYLLAWLLAAGLMFDAMVRCESDLLVLLAVCGGLYLLIKMDRPFAAGAVLSFAAATKLTPLFLAFYFLCKRNWKALAGMAAGGVFLVGILPSLVLGVRGNIERHQRWWHEVIVPYQREGARGIIPHAYRSINQSITAAAFRFLTAMDALGGKEEWYVNAARLDPHTARTLARLAVVVLLCWVLPVWWRTTADAPGLVRGMQYATALIVMLEVSEVSLNNHHVVLLVAFAAGPVCLGAWNPPPRERRAVRWGLVASTLLICLCVKRQLKALSPILFATMVQYFVLVWLLWPHSCFLQGGHMGPPLHPVAHFETAYAYPMILSTRRLTSVR